MKFEKVIFGAKTRGQADFEEFVSQAKGVGATHINISDNLPGAYWEFAVADDPYPAWMFALPGLLKICPPEEMKGYVPEQYSQDICRSFEEQCAVLKREGLKGFCFTNEPQALPEEVFTDHPLWRGPRVDQACRSRSAYFSACADNEEVLGLYRQAMKNLIGRFKEMEIFHLLTTDCGSGFCWSGGLYPGKNGPSWCKGRKMTERVKGFITALREGAREGGGEVEIHMLPIEAWEWMIPTFDDAAGMARQLEAGTAIDFCEGPDASRYMAVVNMHWEWNGFYPVVGIPEAVRFVRDLQAASESGARRLLVDIDTNMRELYFAIFEKFRSAEPKGEVERMTFLQEVAVDEVGAELAGKLVSLWVALDEAVKCMSLFIGPVFLCGAIHQRWLTRPLVPFPGELTEQEKDYYRKYQFQARTEEHADDLADMQAARLYAGWSGKLLTRNILSHAEAHLQKARKLAEQLGAELAGEAGERYEVMALRLQAVVCLLKNTGNGVSYQAQLDRVRSLGVVPDENPVLGTQSSWDRELMMETARNEIDNTVALIEIIESSGEPILDTAASSAEESIRHLGPNLVEQLRKKMNIMNGHWEDYKRMFTTPNP